MNKIVAIGDSHAQYKKMQTLLTNLVDKGINFNKDKLVFLGDYVDGGPEAYELITMLINLGQTYPHWVFLIGNHEDMMLNALKYDAGENNNPHAWYHWYNQGGRATADSYIRMYFENNPGISDYEKSLVNIHNVIPQEHIRWMENLVLTHETESYLFVHAGFSPGKHWAETDVTTRLWIREEFYESDYDWGKIVIAGHTYHKEPIAKPNLINLDTMWHGNGVITAVILDDEKPGGYQFVTSEMKFKGGM